MKIRVTALFIYFSLYYQDVASTGLDTNNLGQVTRKNEPVPPNRKVDNQPNNRISLDEPITDGNQLGRPGLSEDPLNYGADLRVESTEQKGRFKSSANRHQCCGRGDGDSDDSGQSSCFSCFFKPKRREPQPQY